MRKLSTSSKTFGDKKLEKSVEPGVSDRGGMCCSAFLGKGKNIPSENHTESEKTAF